MCNRYLKVVTNRYILYMLQYIIILFLFFIQRNSLLLHLKLNEKITLSTSMGNLKLFNLAVHEIHSVHDNLPV